VVAIEEVEGVTMHRHLKLPMASVDRPESGHVTQVMCRRARNEEGLEVRGAGAGTGGLPRRIVCHFVEGPMRCYEDRAQTCDIRRRHDRLRLRRASRCGRCEGTGDDGRRNEAAPYEAAVHESGPNHAIPDGIGGTHRRTPPRSCLLGLE
jgi:hypothetical protein